MARRDNEVVATITCINKPCDALASVHQYQGGQKKGNFYMRCPDCTANQSGGAKVHKYIQENADWRPGFEHLAESEYKDAKYKPVPVKDESEPAAEPADKGGAEPAEPGKKSAAPILGGLGLLGFLVYKAIKS